MKRTGKSHYERFLAAVAGGDDERAEALTLLLTPQDAPQLLALARSEDPDRRWWALRALAQVGDADAAPVLAEALADPDPAIRAVAAMALASLCARAPDGVTPLLPRLAQLLADDEGLVRQAAGDALARCGEPAAPLLAEALDSPEEGVRVRAAHALHRLRSVSTAPALFRHLNDPNPLVRHHVYETLDEMGLLNNLLWMK